MFALLCECVHACTFARICVCMHTRVHKYAHAFGARGWCHVEVAIGSAALPLLSEAGISSMLQSPLGIYMTSGDLRSGPDVRVASNLLLSSVFGPPLSFDFWMILKIFNNHNRLTGNSHSANIWGFSSPVLPVAQSSLPRRNCSERPGWKTHFYLFYI